MQKRHLDRALYFKEQGITTQKYVIPYIEKHKTVDKNLRVLEIGCGEGGNLKPFIDMGCVSMGIDLNKKQIAEAKRFYANHPNEANVTFLDQDIYEADLDKVGKYDLIIMRDVIEHIHNQERFFGFMKNFLKKDGIVFIGFPPWYMPFGGHQQICKSKFLSSLPYYHILPTPVYKGILNVFNEPQHKVDILLEIKETGISIERIRGIIEQEGYDVLDETMYLINPNYETKFGLTPRKQLGLLGSIPFFRNVLSTCCYYLLKMK